MYTLLLICCCIIFYTYIGYGLLLYLLVMLKRLRGGRGKPGRADAELPAISLVIPAYNEASCIEQKIRNCLVLAYPPDELHIIIITDGSTDETPAIVSQYPQVQLLHQQPRAGKASAINRAMQSVSTPIVVFSDANTVLNGSALQQLATHYGDAETGAVAGEKRVVDSKKGAEPAEGIYWRYESKLKSLESSFYTVMGAAGELFSIRTDLFQPIPADTLLDDLEISLRIAFQGYRIRYEPRAYATEFFSASTRDELKRKLRMAAGGVQTFLRYKHLLFSRRLLLSFEFLSHRVLRWLVAPYLLVLVFFLNLVLVLKPGSSALLQVLFAAQLGWYLFAAAGAGLPQLKKAAGPLSIPYYFCLMNFAMIGGLIRFLRGKQDVLWEKPPRSVSS